MPKTNKFYEPQAVEQKAVVVKVPFNQITVGKNGQTRETIDTLVITAVIRNNGSVSIYNNTGSNIFDFRSVRVEFLNAFIIALTELSQYKPMVDEASADM